MKKVIIDAVEYILTDQITDVEGHDMDEDYTCDICYDSIADGDELTIAQHINPENEQKLKYGICHIACAADVNAEKFLATTNSYYDWKSETSDMYDAILNAENEDEVTQIKANYLAKAAKLTHSCLDVMDEAFKHFLAAVVIKKTK